MRDVVRSTLKDHQLAEPNEPLFVAVSGGLDSMVLLHVLRSLEHPCHVAHVDHGLRGAASDGDREFVEHYCTEHDIPFTARKVDVRARMESTGASVQMAARELRLGWFNELVRQGPSKLAMAHHTDDAIETFFMGMMQGMGLHGWDTIPIRSGPFIRPLLNVTRARIREYAEVNSITWREDASNAETTYLRNRVRHELLPMLENWRPGTHRNLQRNIKLFSELKGSAERTIVDALAPFEADEHGSVRIPFSIVQASGTPLLFLHHMLRDKGFHPDQLAGILDSMAKNKVGARFIRGEDQVLVDRSELVIGKNSGPPASWQIDAATSVPVDAPLTITASGIEAVDHSMDNSVAWLDADRITFPLTLRPWQDGDRMRPMGLGGSKLVSDILIDAKVPRDRKQRTYVLAENDRIIWLCGLRLAERSQVTATTRTVLRCIWSGT